MLRSATIKKVIVPNVLDATQLVLPNLEVAFIWDKDRGPLPLIIIGSRGISTNAEPDGGEFLAILPQCNIDVRDQHLYVCGFHEIDPNFFRRDLEDEGFVVRGFVVIQHFYECHFFGAILVSYRD